MKSNVMNRFIKMSFKLNTTLVIVLLSLSLIGCVVLPVNDITHNSRCEISSDRKTLRIVNVAEETGTYYSIEGLVLSPILVPTTAIISGVYVLTNNIYNLGEQRIVCGKQSQT